ncbi:MAG: DUF1573 domain-containing protein [Bacteroidota bacterium]
MKINHIILACFIAGLAMLFPVKSIAQDSEKKPKVNKELKQVMKELPADLQLQVLRYAEKQKAVYMAAKIKREELANSPKAVDLNDPKVIKLESTQPEKELKAKPNPQKAQELKVSPSQNSNFAPSTPVTAPAAPARPAYMQLAEDMPQTSIEWVEESFDFGEVKEGVQPSHIFKFKNTGDQPLKITRVKPSCGCTTPNWSKEEIAPGGEGFVEVSYNSKNRPGPANKSITVTGNFNERNKVLRFKVNVIRE